MNRESHARFCERPGGKLPRPTHLSIRVEKHNHWIHVCLAGDITLKFAHEKRGLEAMAAIGIIPRYGGVIVHDGWASYLPYEHCAMSCVARTCCAS